MFSRLKLFLKNTLNSWMQTSEILRPSATTTSLGEEIRESFDRQMGYPIDGLTGLQVKDGQFIYPDETPVDVSKETLQRMIKQGETEALPFEPYEPCWHYWEGYSRACKEILEMDGQ